MSFYENLLSTWEKRFMQRHYSYRDSHSAPTVVLTELAELGLFAAEALLPAGPWTVYYPFGYNARRISKFNWPNMGEYASGAIAQRRQCYARDIMVYVTQDTWIRFVSLNPIYLTLIAQGYSINQIAAMGVPQVIIEVEYFMAQRDKDTFYPTYATAIVFRANSTAGMIYISAEGNVEGGE